MAKGFADKDKVYAFYWHGYSTASGIALYMDDDYNGFDGICFLSAGSRAHMIEGKFGKKTKKGFLFYPKREKYPWEFVEVTYDNFKNEFY